MCVCSFLFVVCTLFSCLLLLLFVCFSKLHWSSEPVCKCNQRRMLYYLTVVGRLSSWQFQLVILPLRVSANVTGTHLSARPRGNPLLLSFLVRHVIRPIPSLFPCSFLFVAFPWLYPLQREAEALPHCGWGSRWVCRMLLPHTQLWLLTVRKALSCWCAPSALCISCRRKAQQGPATLSQPAVPEGVSGPWAPADHKGQPLPPCRAL